MVMYVKSIKLNINSENYKKKMKNIKYYLKAYVMIYT